METNHHPHRLELLHRATVAFNESLDLDEIFQRVLEEVSRAIRASGWAVWTLEDGGREMVCRLAAGAGGNRLPGQRLPVDEPLLVPLVTQGESIYLPDTRLSELFDRRIPSRRGEPVLSFAAAPLSSLELEGQLRRVGMIVVIADTPDAFSVDDRALVQALAAAASGALRNGRLYMQARQEIEERRRAEAALRESEAGYRTLVETSPDAVMLVDLAGRIQITNRRAVELFGHTHPADLLGRSYLSLFPPEARPGAIESFESVMQGSVVRGAQSPLIRRDGTLFDGEIAAALAANYNGEPASVVGFARDITDRKQAETAMRRHNEELQILNDIVNKINTTQNLEQVVGTALDSALSAIQVDTGWIVLDVSREHPRVGGVFRIRIERGVLTEGLVKERCRTLCHAVEDEIRRTGKPSTHMTADQLSLSIGHTAPCPVVGIPLVSGSTIVGVLGAVGLNGRHPRNIHARQISLLSAVGSQISIAVENARLSEEAAEVQVLRELERMRAELIANFSHDLRTPLGLIEMSTSTLLRDDIALDANLERELLRDVMTQTRRLSHMVEGILDLGRLESGRLRLDRVTLDLRELVGQVGEEIERRYPDHHLSLDMPQQLPLVADRHRLEQVLYNLLDNAAKYSPRGGNIEVLGRDRDDEVLVCITDSGIGIPEDQLPLVFERYYRVNDEAAEGASGVGLGLAMCRGIIEAHGGRIWADSVYGSGSTFSFTLPVVDHLAV